MSKAAAPLWTATAVALAVKGRALGDFSATGVAIDSRQLAPGDLFVALKGPNFDGHDYIRNALAAGAAGALAHRLPPGLGENAPIVLAGDSLRALEDLGRAARARAAAEILAVTGSVGKTGTKEMLRAALGAGAATFASAGNLNNHWGTPLSLARMDPRAAFGIFELGMNHAGEIAPLSRLARPHLALITWIAPAHVEFFDSVAAIADAKAEIFLGLEPDGVAVLPRDNEHFQRLEARAIAAGVRRRVTFGEHEESEARLLDCRVGAEGNDVEASLFGKRLRFRMKAGGRHLAQNAMAVLAAVAVLGADLGKAVAALGGLEALPGRGRREIVPLAAGSLVLIDEAYNASPAAMRAAIAVLGQQPIAAGGRRIAVLGDMRELGRQGAELHRALAADLTENGIERVYAVGPLSKNLFEALPEAMRARHAMSAAEMAVSLPAELRAGDAVLVKGSLGTRMALLVEAVRALDPAQAGSHQAANGH